MTVATVNGQPQRLAEQVRHHRAERHELAVGEVRQARRPEDQRQADGRDGEDQAEPDAVDRALGELLEERQRLPAGLAAEEVEPADVGGEARFVEGDLGRAVDLDAVGQRVLLQRDDVVTALGQADQGDAGVVGLGPPDLGAVRRRDDELHAGHRLATSSPRRRPSGTGRARATPGPSHVAACALTAPASRDMTAARAATAIGRSARRRLAFTAPSPPRPCGARRYKTGPGDAPGARSCGGERRLDGRRDSGVGAARRQQQPHRHRPQRGRPGHVDADEQRRHVVEVLDVADARPAARRRRATTRSPVRGRAVRRAVAARGRRARRRGRRSTITAMPWTRAAVEMCDVEALDVLVAGVRPGAGDDRAGDDGHGRWRSATAHVRPRLSRRRRRAGATRAVGLTGPAQQHDGRARRATIDSSMWPCTASGWRSTSTVIPPSTIWPSTPATSPSESHVRSRRRGVRHSEPSTAAITATATRPVNSRLTCSMAAWFDDTSIKLLVVAVRPVVAAQPRPGQPDRGAGDDDRRSAARGRSP